MIRAFRTFARLAALVLGLSVACGDVEAQQYSGGASSTPTTCGALSDAGSACQANVGTSGNAVPKVNAANTWSATQTANFGATQTVTPELIDLSGADSQSTLWGTGVAVHPGASLPGDARTNDVGCVGWNFSGDVNRVTSQHAGGTCVEWYYRQGGSAGAPAAMEWYFKMRSAAPTVERRPLGFYLPIDGGAGSSGNLSVDLIAITKYDGTPSQQVDLVGKTWDFNVSGWLIRNNTNASAWLQMRNAANSGYVSLPYVNSLDMIQFDASPYLLAGGVLTWNNDTFIARHAAAWTQFGGADAATATSQTIGVQNVSSGNANVAGADVIYAGSAGTGSAVGGSMLFKVAPAGSAGSSQNTLATAMTIASTKLVTLADGINIATNVALVTDTGQVKLGTAGDVILRRGAAAKLTLGDVDSATPVAQTIAVQSVVAGTTNTAGQTMVIQGSRGTGTGAGGNIVFQVAGPGSTGSSQNGLSNALTIQNDKSISTGSGINLGANGQLVFNVGTRTQALANGSYQLSNSASNDFGLLILGSNTNAFPALKRETTGVRMRLGDDTADTTIKASAFIAGGAVPVVTGSCTSGTVTGGTTAGQIATVTCTAQTLIFTFATTAPNGWVCDVQDETTAGTFRQTAHTATTCTVTATTAASDTLVFGARAF